MFEPTVILTSCRLEHHLENKQDLRLFSVSSVKKICNEGFSLKGIPINPDMCTDFLKQSLRFLREVTSESPSACTESEF